ncbi:MAG TPA: hypothetical protein VNV87_00070 [Acidimicrobiales bacterium]|nr:hypothetical protein [Acidimicrobiales bacterium]
MLGLQRVSPVGWALSLGSSVVLAQLSLVLAQLSSVLRLDSSSLSL